jgi:hypothetical protein
MSAQATVLERNISTDTVLEYKRASVANVGRLVALVLRHLPELGHAAYESDESLRVFELDFTTALRDALEVILAGLVHQ